jgi:hypothetical protein
MRRGVPIPEEVEATIKAELAKIAHASRVARESKGAWSYATVWRVAARAGIELTAGRRTMGRPLPPEQRAKVEQAVARIPRRRRRSSRANAGSAARPSAGWCARAARRRSWWDDAHSGKRDLEAERNILSLISRLQAPPAPA